MSRKLIVEVVGDAGKLNKTLDEATGHAGGFKNVLTGIGQGIGQAAFGLLDTAISGSIKFLGDADAAFKEDQVSVALLGTALQNNIPNWDGNTAAVEAAAVAAQKKGFADDEARAALGQLVGVTHDQKAAIDLMTIAEDLARAKNIDLATATDIVTKAHEGNGKALKALGIDIAGAKDAASLLDAIQKNVNGSAEKWAATSEGKVAVSQQKTSEAMEKLGAIVDKFTSVALPLLADAFSTIIDVVTQVWEAIQPGIQTVMPHLQNAFKIIGDVAGVVFPIIGTVAGAMGTTLGLVFTAIGTAIEILKGVFQGLSTFVGGIFDGIVSIIRGAVNVMIDVINGAIDGINMIPTIDIGDVHIGIPKIGHIPKLHAGGIVPGAIGSDQLTILQAGEMVTPVSGVGAARDVVINIYEAQDVPGMLQALRRELNRQGVSLA